MFTVYRPLDPSGHFTGWFLTRGPDQNSHFTGWSLARGPDQSSHFTGWSLARGPDQNSPFTRWSLTRGQIQVVALQGGFSPGGHKFTTFVPGSHPCMEATPWRLLCERSVTTVTTPMKSTVGEICDHSHHTHKEYCRRDLSPQSPHPSRTEAKNRLPSTPCCCVSASVPASVLESTLATSPGLLTDPSAGPARWSCRLSPS